MEFNSEYTGLEIDDAIRSSTTKYLLNNQIFQLSEASSSNEIELALGGTDGYDNIVEAANAGKVFYFNDKSTGPYNDFLNITASLHISVKDPESDPKPDGANLNISILTDYSIQSIGIIRNDITNTYEVEYSNMIYIAKNYSENQDTNILCADAKYRNIDDLKPQQVFRLGNKLMDLTDGASVTKITEALEETKLEDIENACSKKMLFYGHETPFMEYKAFSISLSFRNVGNSATITYTYIHGYISYTVYIRYDKVNVSNSYVTVYKYNINNNPYILGDHFWSVDPLGQTVIDSYAISEMIGGESGLDEIISVALKGDRPFIIPRFIEYNNTLGNVLGTAILSSMTATTTETTKQISYTGFYENYFFSNKITYDIPTSVFSIVKFSKDMTIA